MKPFTQAIAMGALYGAIFYLVAVVLGDTSVGYFDVGAAYGIGWFTARVTA